LDRQGERREEQRKVAGRAGSRQGEKAGEKPALHARSAAGAGTPKRRRRSWRSSPTRKIEPQATTVAAPSASARSSAAAGAGSTRTRGAAARAAAAGINAGRSSARRARGLGAVVKTRLRAWGARQDSISPASLSSSTPKTRSRAPGRR